VTARQWPRVSIEIGGPPPSRRALYRPWFFLDWFGGDEYSRRQLSVFIPFLKVRIYP